MAAVGGVASLRVRSVVGFLSLYGENFTAKWNISQQEISITFA